MSHLLWWCRASAWQCHSDPGPLLLWLGTLCHVNINLWFCMRQNPGAAREVKGSIHLQDNEPFQQAGMLHRPSLQTSSATGSQKARHLTGREMRQAQGVTHRHQVGISALRGCLALDWLPIGACSSYEWLRPTEAWLGVLGQKPTKHRLPSLEGQMAVVSLAPDLQDHVRVLG